MTHPFDEIAVEAAASVEYAAWRENSMQFRSDPNPLPTWGECDPNLKQLFLTRATAAISAAFQSARDRGVAVDFPESTTAWHVPVTIIRHKENE